MHRAPLLRLLKRYLERWPEDRARIAPMIDFVQTHEDCFERSCEEGHVTGSAWILSPDHRRVLLTHHRKLGRWLQLGGHADGDADPLRVALREAREESGLQGLRPLPDEPDPVPLDVDIHAIPQRGSEAAHLHFDVRFLLEAVSGEEFLASEESHALQWVERELLDEFVGEESQLRMERRARELLAQLSPLKPESRGS
jgi:8-oxo-dGTP pyrophosphatase MutT (NUDIX family)